MKTLKTARLSLRTFRKSDLKDLYAYASNPQVGARAGWEPHRNLEMSLDVLRSFIERSEVWAIVHTADNKVIGSVGLHTDEKRSIPHVKMLGYAMAEEYWGQGLATEAAKRVVQYGFVELHLDLIAVYHYVGNDRSRRVIEKCGFQYEGTLRSAERLFNGDTVDHVCYSMKQEEFWKLSQAGVFV